MMFKRINIILILIVLLGVFLRLFLLEKFPVQLNHDEITQLYDAISIAETGRDIYGNTLPFIFQSVNDYKPPFYTYITSLFYLFFGGGELTIRLPSAFFGILTILGVYIFTLKLFKDKKVALAASFFTSIAPFEIFYSRKGFENGAGIFLMLLGFSYIFKYFESSKIKWIYLAAGLFGVAMYTYFSHTIILPLLLTLFILIYIKKFKKDSKHYLKPLLFFVLIISYLIFMLITNPDTRFRSRTVFITQDPLLGKQISNTDNEFEKWKEIFDFSFNRYLKQFEPLYLFGNGLDLTNQGPLGSGPLLLIQLPFLLLGILLISKKENFNEGKKFILAWILLGMVPSGLTFEEYSPHRVVMVFTMLNIICGLGLVSFLNMVGKKRFIASLIFIFALVLNFLYFAHIYFVNFPYEKSEHLHYPFKQLAQFAWSQYSNFDTIIIDPYFGEYAPHGAVGVHYYLAYYGHYDPAEFQKDLKLTQDSTSFGKFVIRKVHWSEDNKLNNTLIIASSWSIPIESVDKSLIMKNFYFYNGKAAFYAVKL